MTAPAPEGLSAWLRAVVHAGRDGGPLPEAVPDYFVRLRRRIQRDFADPPAAASTWIGSPEEPGGAEGHWAALYAAYADGRPSERDPVLAAEAGFHAAFLLGAMTDEDRGFRPRVSAVLSGSGASAEDFLPVVESLLDQTHTELEIIVFDRSATFFEERLGPAASRVKIVDDHVEDPALALDRALDVAKGEVVQFVDLAHRFVSSAIERKLAVFESVPEASVVFDGDKRLASLRERLLSGAFDRRELPVSAFMVPRHVLLRTGAFDEGIGAEGIDRYWARVRARPEGWIGIQESLRSSTSPVEESSEPWSSAAIERSILDRLSRPARWSSLAEALERLTPGNVEAFAEEAGRRLVDVESASVYSSRPVLALVRDALARSEETPERDAALSALDQRLAEAPDVGIADLDLWVDAESGRPQTDGGVAVDVVFDRLRESIRIGEPIVEPERLLRIARSRPDRLDRYFCRQIVRWSRRMSVSAACELACTIMPYAVDPALPGPPNLASADAENPSTDPKDSNASSGEAPAPEVTANADPGGDE